MDQCTWSRLNPVRQTCWVYEINYRQTWEGKEGDESNFLITGPPISLLIILINHRQNGEEKWRPGLASLLFLRFDEIFPIIKWLPLVSNGVDKLFIFTEILKHFNEKLTRHSAPSGYAVTALLRNTNFPKPRVSLLRNEKSLEQIFPRRLWKHATFFRFHLVFWSLNCYKYSFENSNYLGLDFIFLHNFYQIKTRQKLTRTFSVSSDTKKLALAELYIWELVHLLVFCKIHFIQNWHV